MRKQPFSNCELNVIRFDTMADVITTSGGIVSNGNAFDSEGNEDLWDLYDKG